MKTISLDDKILMVFYIFLGWKSTALSLQLVVQTEVAANCAAHKILETFSSDPT